jgi:hypothetical protein
MVCFIEPVYQGWQDISRVFYVKAGFLKSLLVPPSAAEEGGKLSGDTWGQRPARPGRGYRPCTPFSATFEKPYCARFIACQKREKRLLLHKLN